MLDLISQLGEAMAYQIKKKMNLLKGKILPRFMFVFALFYPLDWAAKINENTDITKKAI